MKKKKEVKKRNIIVVNMIERSASAGSHSNRDYEVSKGKSRKQKHKKPPGEGG